MLGNYSQRNRHSTVDLKNQGSEPLKKNQCLHFQNPGIGSTLGVLFLFALWPTRLQGILSPCLQAHPMIDFTLKESRKSQHDWLEASEYLDERWCMTQPLARGWMSKQTYTDKDTPQMTDSQTS